VQKNECLEQFSESEIKKIRVLMRGIRYKFRLDIFVIRFVKDRFICI
jgi:hypothetical protein